MWSTVKRVAVPLLLFLSWPSLADSLPQPSGKVILTVSGAIVNTNGEENGEPVARFDRAMLEAMPQHSFTTITPWTDGKHQYQGVLLHQLLKQLGADGDRIEARALNDYFATIELEPIADYPVLLAMQVDGQPMRVRTKGPLWILYPLSDYPELDTKQHHVGMVWQLDRIKVK